MARRVAIDIETSGLNPNAGGEIIMISALELLDGRQLGAVFLSRTRPSRPLSPLAEDLTGISNAMLADAPHLAEIIDEFLDFIAGAELICVNAEFDRSFLNAALADLHHPALAPDRFMDLMNRVPTQFRGRGIDGVLDYAGIKNIPGEPAEEVAHLYWALFGH